MPRSAISFKNFMFLIGTVVPLTHAAFSYQNCADLQASDFKEVVLVDKIKDPTLNEPLGFGISKDGRIFFSERVTGAVKTISPTGQIFLMGKFAVHGKSGISDELGLRFVTPDPHFDTNRWLYLMMTPLDQAVNRLVRVHVKDDWTLDMATAKTLLEMPWTYDKGNHQGGAMAWDAHDNLWVSSGNNKEQSGDGYSVTDERNFSRDNQSGAANSMDFRGKIIRIKPLPFADTETPTPGPGKTYSIPSMNLREYGVSKGYWDATTAEKVLPELYTLGHRNPYSINVDKYTGWLTWGDVGPDATDDDAGRGPAGNDEFNLIDHPGFGGWPYFMGANLPYVKWDYANNSSLGVTWDVNAPMNESKLNTGVKRLPPAHPAILPESKKPGVTSLLPQGGGTCAISGPIYHYDGSNTSKVKLPPHFDGKWFVAEFSKNWIKVATVDQTLTKVTDLQNAPFKANPNSVLTMEIGPDGALYILNYGGYFNSTDLTRISRIEYTGTCSPATPIPKLPTAIQLRKRLTDTGIQPMVGGKIQLEPNARGLQMIDLSGRIVYSVMRSHVSIDGWVNLPVTFKNGLYRTRMLF